MRRLPLVLSFVLLPGWAGAAVYNVDCNAGAGGGGTAAAPWDTVSDVNESTFSAGDSVLFKRGCTWRETLRVPSSGSAVSPLTFGAYGTGAAPILNGGMVAQSWTAEAIYYFKTGFREPKFVYEDGLLLTAISTNKASMSAGSWWWDSVNSRLYIRCTGGADPATKTIEVVDLTWEDQILVQDKSYVTVENLAVKNSKGAGIRVRANGATVSNVVVRGNTVSYSALSNIVAGGSVNYAASAVTITGNTASYSAAFGILFSSRISSSTASYNAVDHSGVRPSGTDYGWHGISAYGAAANDRPSLITIENNTVTTTYGCDACSYHEGAGIQADDNSLQVTIRYNSIHDNEGYGVMLSGAGSHSAYYNLVYGNANSGIRLASANAKVYNNLLYNNVASGISGSVTQDSCTVRNNILYDNLTKEYDFVADTTRGITLDYNLVYHSAGGTFVTWQNTSHSWASWKTSSGQDAHSLNSDPLRVSNSDFHLQAGSPAINAGVDVGLTRDHEGQPIAGGAPDIGAYEFSLPLTLSVARVGNGSGTVASSPGGITCGADCSETYSSGTMVTLSQTASAGSTLSGWSGACTGTGACQVTMNAAKSITATFTLIPVTHTLTAARAGDGGGTVTSSPAGINCGADCSEPYNSGTLVTLTPTPVSGSVFVGWGGACTGTGACQATMTAARSVTATFTLAMYTLNVTKAGTGTGTVTSSPAGISCGADCSEPYNRGTVVSLAATPATGSLFAGWGGACSGTIGCQVTIDAARSVTASFSIASGPHPPGDFNRDGSPDLLWHNQASGSLYVWLLVNGKTTGGSYLTPDRFADTRWQIRGVIDFNNDGQTDILWHHQTTGDLYVWLMNGMTAASGTYLTPSRFADTSWQIRGLSDFNGDGKIDILWHHQKTGDLYVWFMNGATAISGVYLTPSRFADANWQIRGLADFNGDGKADVLWHHQRTGDLYVWLMNGTTAAGGSYLTPSRFADTRWQIVRVADFNGGGQNDMLWHHQQTGDLYVWYLNGTVTVSGGYLTPSRFADTNWKVAPTR